MADWKFLGGITALGGLIGFFGAKTIDVKKLPAGEKAVLTGASTGATMEGLDLALGAEGCDHVPILGDIIEETDDGVIAEMTCELCGAEGTHYMDSDYNDLGSEWDAESYSAEGVTLLMTLLTKARKEASDYEMGYDYQWKILNMRGNSYDIDLSMSRLESRTELMSKVQWTLSNLIDELVEESLDLSAESSSEQKFRHKKTGEIATQISLMDIKNWEKLEAESLKRDSCCCGATKSNPCACMIQGVMVCSATCPCSLEKKAESIQFKSYTDPISDRQKWLIKQKGGEYSNNWTRSEGSKYIKELLNAKPKAKPKPKITIKQPKTSFRNPLSIIPTSLVDEVGVIFNKDNDEVIGAVAHTPQSTFMLLVGDAQQGVNKDSLKMIDPSISNLWFAWKQEPLIIFEDNRFIVGVEGIINYNIRPFDIEGCAQYKQINIPSKPTTKDDTYKTIGEIRKLKEDIKLGNWMFNIKTLKQAISKLPAKDTFESYFNPKGLWMLEGSDWTLYLAGRKI